MKHIFRLTLSVFTLLLLVSLFTFPAIGEGDFEEIDIKVSPHTIVLSSQGVWVTVHADIPYNEVGKQVLELNGVPFVFSKYDDRGDLVVKFNLDEVKDVVEPPEAELVLIGAKTDGSYFRGTETVRVIEGSN